jgi:DNA-binding transcriptional ArsR family regulator
MKLVIAISLKRPSSNNEEQTWRLMELLVDPVRAQIYFEVLTQREVTAQQLMKRLPIARSTLTHHLTKFVKAKVFSVRVESTGRPIKHYSLNRDFEEAVVIADKDDEDTSSLKKRVTFLESAAAHLQMISNLTRTLAHKLAKNAKLERPSKGPVCFVFSLLSDEEAAIWNKHHNRFLAEVESEIKKLAKSGNQDSQTRHVAFSGLIPVVSYERTDF